GHKREGTMDSIQSQIDEVVHTYLLTT
ncbi:hypothetical protein LCGC14_2769230, partial [marine sediment metagenome]